MRSARSIPKSLWLLALVAVMALPLLAQEAAQKPVQDSRLVVPVGTVLPVSLNTYLNTKNTEVGDTFYADTTYPIWIQQRLVIPRGSIVKGTVTEVGKPGKISGKGRMAVRFESILLPNGIERALVADFHGIHGPGAEKIDRKTETVEQGGTSNKGADIATVVGTAGEGAMIGSIASGRTASGAGIGAGAGAAAGVAIVLLSRSRDLVLEPGTQLDLELRQPLSFAYSEIIFSQSELNSAQRAPVTRPGRTQTRQPSGFSWLRFPRIWRW
jgi:type IV secretion system protein VirB10